MKPSTKVKWNDPESVDKETIRLITEYKEINNMRAELGLPPIISKPRKCMRCDKKFMSIGNNNRMCSHCNGHFKEYGGTDGSGNHLYNA